MPADGSPARSGELRAASGDDQTNRSTPSEQQHEADHALAELLNAARRQRQPHSVPAHSSRQDSAQEPAQRHSQSQRRQPQEIQRNEPESHAVAVPSTSSLSMMPQLAGRYAHEGAASEQAGRQRADERRHGMEGRTERRPRHHETPAQADYQVCVFAGAAQESPDRSSLICICEI